MFDFDEVIDRRNTHALKWDMMEPFYGVPPEAYTLRALDRIESSQPSMLAPGHGAALTGNLAPYYRAYRTLAGESRATRPVDTAPMSAPLRKHVISS